jgi:hypothetical protein
MSTADATSIQAGLVSTNPVDVEAVLAPQVASQYAKAPKTLWPAGSVITIDRTRMRRLGPDLATVPATVTGPEPGTWQFLLVKTNGRWLVLSTSAVK